MLTRRDAERITLRGFTTHHDFWATSLMSGEPFFEENLLAYFDGRAVTVCAFPLRGDAPPAQETLRRVALLWATERGAESLVFIGPERFDLHFLKREGFRRVLEDHRGPMSSELLIDCTSATDSALGLRAYKRARSSGFKVRLRAGGIATAEYLALIEQFYRLRQLSTYLAEHAFVIPAILRARRVRFVEAWRGERLCGFVALHRAFADICVGLLLAHDHHTEGVSDFLYSQMLDCARRLGAHYVNVGPSPTSGHYDFKRKWGGRPFAPPYHLVQWARGHIARRYHVAWGPRLVRL
ncbi:MAG TPA: hypothetical protein VFX96_08530 [Pyrinomonadaceae bacterium]|nr:hypothetical protein [Pyrinomonadaceae bacterium]